MPDDSPFFHSGEEYDSYQDIHPEIESLTVEAELVDIVGDVEQSYRFNEDTLPSHIDCANCGHRLQFGWEIDPIIQRREEDIDIIVSCPGEEYEGRSCVYSLDIEGEVTYSND